MIERFRLWLSDKLDDGFWFPTFRKTLTYLYEKFSLGYRFKRWLKTKEKSPAGASELYQLCWLVTALLWVALIEVSVPLPSTVYARGLGVVIATYPIVEIMLFTLYWVFVEKEETLHSVRRSLVAFILNLIEIALYASVVRILTVCTPRLDSPWRVVHENLKATFSLSYPSTTEVAWCHVVSHGQLAVAAMLISVVVASLVNGVLREEKKAA